MPRRRTIVLVTATVLLGIAALAVSTVAMLTQTERGRAMIMRAVLPTLRRALPGQLYVGRVSGTLFADITIDSLEIREPGGLPFVRTGPIRVTYDPRDLLDRRVVIKSLEITRPYLTVVDYGGDDWNWKRALRRKGPSTPRRRGGFGDYIVLDTVTLHEATLIMRQPWTLSDSLKGAKRDSALTYNLTRVDGEIRRDGDGFARIWRFVRGNIALGRTRIADPDSAGLQVALRKLDVVWVYPPFWFRNMHGTVRQLGDSLWMDETEFQLANSHGRGDAKIVWGSGKPVRYDIRIQGDTVAMADVAWIDESLPRTGGGSTMLTIKNDPRNLSIIEYGLRNMDARAMRSHLTGRMTFGVGGEVLRVTDVALDLAPAHTDLLRQFNGEPFPYDWQGTLSGRIAARGGPVTKFQIDAADFTYDDAHVPGAQTRGFASGVADIFTPAEAILKGIDLRIDQLDLRTPRFVNPLFLEVNGIVRGTMRLDSLWYDARFSNADLEHIDGPGLPSHLTGSGRYTLVPEGVKFDLSMEAAPLSYTTLSRSYPGLPLRGSAVGSIRAKGMAEDFDLQVTLAGEGGELAFTGRVDGFEPSYAATGQFRVRSANLEALFGDSRFPQSNLSLAGDVALSGSSLASLRGPLRATVDQFSRVADVRVFGGAVHATFDSGQVRIDTLMLESSALRLTARGGLGLVADRADTLQFVAAIDSLGGLRPWLQSGDSLTRVVNPSDTLRGTIEIRGRLAGTIDTTDARGLALDARADAIGLVFGTARAARANAALAVTDVMHGGNGQLDVTMDSARTAGIDISAAAGRSTLQRGLADRFAAELRTPTEARLAVTGGVSRVSDTTTLRIDTLTVRVDSGPARPRGFSLAAPAIVRIAPNHTGTLDSLVLVHTDTGRFALRGTIGDSGVLRGRVDLDRVSLADVGRLIPGSGLAGGTASAYAVVTGTREQPRFDGELSLREAVAGRMRFSALDAKTRYDSLRLSVEASLGVGGKPALAVTASLPIDLALVAGRTRQRNEPLTGRILSNRADLALLESVFPDVTSARGRFSTDLQLTGTWERPQLRGQLQMDSAALTLANLGVRLEQATADIGIANDTVFIRRFGAISGARADSLGISGTISLVEPRKPAFDLRLTANNFLAIDKPRTASLVLTTTTPVSLTGNSDAARVRGAVRIDRGKVYIRALAQRRGLDLTDNFDVVDTTFLGFNALLPNAPSALLQNLVLDNVRVNIGDDVWLRSPEANLKLGGALRVTRAVGRDGSRARLALADSLVVERGTYQLNLGIARPSFEVDRGVVRFYGDPDLEPALDITALHTVRELRANSNRQDVRIRVSIGGTLDRPTLALSSADNPPLPESDMLSYLVTGEPAYALLGTTAYAEQGATLLLRYAGSYLSSRLAGGRFDVVQVEPTAIAPGEAANLRANGLGILASTRVGVGGQLARNTYFAFTTGLCGLSAQTSGGGDALSLFAQGLGVKLERRFDRGFSVSLGLEPASSAQACGRLGISRTFQQTPPQIGIDFFRAWTF
ncbi:MAG: translocation/assembly module TamB domain-containing protein [Gemmatimonadaceae bacterium]|nr:translocation/assembly module TamB domain-containing protein [Gemmatimonadaceae bacterium]